MPTTDYITGRLLKRFGILLTQAQEIKNPTQTYKFLVQKTPQFFL